MAGTGPQHITINVSARQVRAPEFGDHLREILAATSLPADRVTLEITETILIAEIESASDYLALLRALGVRIAIDDFGTGQCSLSYLQRFPVDVVKFDRQFVDELGEDPRSMSLAKMILQLTSGLDVMSVAEGIERPGVD